MLCANKPINLGKTCVVVEQKSNPKKASTERQKYRKGQKYNRPKLRQTDMTNNRTDINVDILANNLSTIITSVIFLSGLSTIRTTTTCTSSNIAQHITTQVKNVIKNKDQFIGPVNRNSKGKIFLSRTRS